MKLRDTLLIMGDENSSRPDLREIFENTYNILEAVNRDQLFSLLEQNQSCIAALILDIPPTPTRETSITYTITSNPDYREIPVIIVMPRNDIENELRAYEYGASDAISKPYTQQVVYRRVQAIVELFMHKSNLEVMVDQQAEILRHSNEVMVDALSSIIEYRSAESGRHVQRIRHFARVLLEDIAVNYPEYNLTPESIQSIVSATTLHDIGKISIPDYILNKPGQLTAAEFDIMKKHTTNGAQIVAALSGIADQTYLRYAYNIALYHHERWDGSGYPKGLRGEEIPICAQVTSLADVYDALTTDRVYKERYPHTQAVNMILNKECGTFSPKILDAFKNVKDQFASLAETFADGTVPVSDDFTAPLPGPDFKSSRTDTMQLLQMKYQALLHYIDATVLELDLNAGSYHIVFNPNPDFALLGAGTSFEAAAKIMIDNVIHEDDREKVSNYFRNMQNAFFRQGLRKYSCIFRMYNTSRYTFQPYEITALQLNYEESPRDVALLILWPLSGEQAETAEAPQPLLNQSVFTDLIGSLICVRNDRNLTILEGGENLFRLTGYTKEEIEKKFHNCIMELVLPEDRETLTEQMRQQLAHGDFMEVEHRVRKKNGTIIWLLIKCRLAVTPQGDECFYASMLNNTKARSAQDRLQFMLERNEIIMNQSDDIIFEWDFIQDTVSCSSKWEQRFGYPLATENFSKNIYRMSYFHPDDLQKLVQSMRRVRGGGSHLEEELRIINASGRYTWNRIRATLQRDKKGTPLRVIGVIVDIDSTKRVAQQLQEKAEQDALTGLLNREAAQQRISSALLKHDQRLLSALLMIDLDNFKTVNDTYGHLYGDAVLTRVAAEIKKLFRNNDVISRIGGDEFMVFLNGIPDDNLVKSRCGLLVENLRGMFKEMMPGAPISCSIGAALYPVHGTTYVDLYQKADKALYYSKSQGKNGYSIYDEKLTLVSKNPMSAISARIDSDETPGMAEHTLIHTIFQRMYESKNLQESINEILAEVGRALNVSRVYIFENNDTNTECSNTFEWCNEGIEPEIEFLQNLSYLRGPVQGWDENFSHSDVFYCADISKLPERFRQVLEPQNIKSLLHCAIRDNGVFRGYVGFDDCTSNHLWTQQQIDLLSFLSQIISVFLLKKRDQERITRLTNNLQTLIDSQNAWIYVIDPETFRLKYINAQTRALSPQIEENARCYEVLLGRSQRCENCPACTMGENQKHSTFIFNDHFGLKVHCEATKIQWDGEDARLITCHKIED